MAKKIVFLISVAVVVNWCIAAVVQQYLYAITADQMRVLILYLLILFSLVAAILAYRFR